MENYLCLIRQDENVDWYMLCVKETMFCISCGPMDTIVENIRGIKKRYRTVYGLKEALSNMSEPARSNPFTRQTYTSLYREQKGKYDRILKEVMEGEYERIREKRKVKKPVLMKGVKEERPKSKKEIVLTRKEMAKVKKPIVMGRTKKAKQLDME